MAVGFNAAAEAEKNINEVLVTNESSMNSKMKTNNML